MMIMILLIIFSVLITVFSLCCLSSGITIVSVLLLTAVLCLDILHVVCIKKYILPHLRILHIPEEVKQQADYFKQHDSEPFIAFIEHLLWNNRAQISRQQEFDSLNNRSNFLALQSQINPHFLYNTLESIRGEAVISGTPLIARMLKTLSKYYRYNVGSSDNLVSLHDELENVKNYVAIQQFRFEDRISLDIRIDPEDKSCMDYMVVKLSLQPIVENSIYYGLEPKNEKGHINIDIRQTPHRLVITVSDNGVGIKPEKLAVLNEQLTANAPADSGSHRGSGIALSNINQRIRLCFGEEYGMIVRSIPGCGTDTEINLPIVQATAANHTFHNT